MRASLQGRRKREKKEAVGPPTPGLPIWWRKGLLSRRFPCIDPIESWRPTPKTLLESPVPRKEHLSK